MSRIDGNTTIGGTLTVNGTACTLPTACITDSNMSAGSPAGVTKTVHQHLKQYAQESATAAADGAFVIHVAQKAGTLTNFDFGAVVANIGVSVVAFDLLKDGATMLSGTNEIDSGDAAYALVAGTIGTAAYAADTVWEVKITGTAGGGTLAKGVFAQATFSEAADT